MNIDSAVATKKAGLFVSPAAVSHASIYATIDYASAFVRDSRKPRLNMSRNSGE